MEKDKILETIQWYDENAQAYAQQMGLNKSMKDFMKSLSAGGKILDAGCGGGLDTYLFNKKGFNAIGLDLSGGLLKEAQEKYPDNDFVKGDLRQLPFPKDFFDGIWSRASLVHFENLKDVEMVISEFHRVLKQNGLIFILVKGHSNAPEKPVIEGKTSTKRYFQYFESGQIKQLLENASFEIKRIEEFTEDKKKVDGRPEVNWIEVWGIKK